MYFTILLHIHTLDSGIGKQVHTQIENLKNLVGDDPDRKNGLNAERTLVKMFRLGESYQLSKTLKLGPVAGKMHWPKGGAIYILAFQTTEAVLTDNSP